MSDLSSAPQPAHGLDRGPHAGGALRVALTVEQLWQRVPGGSGTYIVELARELARRDDTRVLGLSAAHRGAPADGGPDLPVRSLGLPREVLYRAWNHARAPRPEWTVPGIDVVHATTWAVPATRRPLVVTVHDLAFLRDPGHFTPRGVRFFTRALERVRDEAEVVVVPSRVTADDCRAAGIEATRLRVVHHGVRVPAVSAGDVEQFRARHGLTRPYVLWCGTHEPRKNLSGLLAAWQRLRGAGDTELVLVGPAGWGDTLGGDRDVAGVHHLGRLGWDDLHAAYAGARAFCFPSLWEGFGMPVLEAMAHGVPVVTSAGTSMAEVAGEAAVLVDPTDPDALAAGIAEAVGPAHERLSAASTRRAADFRWARAAELTRHAYADARASVGGAGG